jgi:hypothetical protein
MTPAMGAEVEAHRQSPGTAPAPRPRPRPQARMAKQERSAAV